MKFTSLTTDTFTKSAFNYLVRLQGCFNTTNLEAVEKLASIMTLPLWCDLRGVGALKKKRSFNPNVKTIEKKVYRNQRMKPRSSTFCISDARKELLERMPDREWADVLEDLYQRPWSWKKKWINVSLPRMRSRERSSPW